MSSQTGGPLVRSVPEVMPHPHLAYVAGQTTTPVETREGATLARWSGADVPGDSGPPAASTAARWELGREIARQSADSPLEIKTFRSSAAGASRYARRPCAIGAPFVHRGWTMQTMGVLGGP